MMLNHYPAGTTVTFAPDSANWVAQLRKRDKTGAPVSVPVIGWATVTSPPDDDCGTCVTIEPVVLMNSSPAIAAELREDYGLVIDKIEWGNS